MGSLFFLLFLYSRQLRGIQLENQTNQVQTKDSCLVAMDFLVDCLVETIVPRVMMVEEEKDRQSQTKDFSLEEMSASVLINNRVMLIMQTARDDLRVTPSMGAGVKLFLLDVVEDKQQEERLTQDSLTLDASEPQFLEEKQNRVKSSLMERSIDVCHTVTIIDVE